MERTTFKALDEVERMTLSQVVGEQIKQYIIDHDLKAGEKLPSERALVDKLEVSRSVVREALSSLEMMGILKIVHGEGAYVQSFNVRPLLGFFAFQWKRDKQSREEIYELRAMMTVAALEQWMMAPTEEQMAALQGIVHEMKQRSADEDFRAWCSSDYDFHLTLARFSEQRLFASLLETLLGFAEKAHTYSEAIDHRATTALYESLMQAIEAHDEAAAKSYIRTYFAYMKEKL